LGAGSGYGRIIDIAVGGVEQHERGVVGTQIVFEVAGGRSRNPSRVVEPPRPGRRSPKALTRRLRR
jgi:hypothetical protein